MAFITLILVAIAIMGATKGIASKEKPARKRRAPVDKQCKTAPGKPQLGRACTDDADCAADEDEQEEEADWDADEDEDEDTTGPTDEAIAA